MNDIEFEQLLKRSLIKAAELDYISDIPPEEELNINPSEDFNVKMAKLLNDPKTYVRRRSLSVYQRALRSAAVVLLVVSVLFGLSMLHPVAHAKFAELVRSWFPDHTAYSYEGYTGSVMPKAATLKYVPDGFELVFEEFDDLTAILVYQSEKGEKMFVEFVSDTGRLHLDNERHEIYTLSVGNSIVDIYESNSARYYSSLVYDDKNNELILVITGSLPIDELIQIFEGLEY